MQQDASPREGSHRHRGTIEIRRQSINERLPFSSLHEGTPEDSTIKLRHSQRCVHMTQHTIRRLWPVCSLLLPEHP